MSYTDLLHLKKQAPAPPQPVPEPVPEPRQHGSAPEAVVSRHRGTTLSPFAEVYPAAEETLIQTVRKSVKEFGKEAATHRFTEREKRLLAEIEYVYKRDFKIKTTENELTRIAVNYLLQDYQLHREKSIFHQCLLSLTQ